MVVTYDFLAKYGQLGNQMFQYALLLGIKHKIEADIVIHPEVKQRSYLFDFFDLKECQIKETHTLNVYQEKHFHFDQDVFNIDRSTNFRGYFQTEKYFEHCSSVVKKEYTFKKEISNRVDNFLKPYENKVKVSLHVRRGDYLVHPDAHPLCTVEYYNNAIKMLDGDDVVFVCTSDDIAWCKDNLKIPNIVYNKQDLAHDMCLISKCDHHIIANSTFSWWGSWLSINQNKKIIAPKTWFGSRYSDWNVNDLYCDNFVKI
jgi:hypothetical protein